MNEMLANETREYLCHACAMRRTSADVGSLPEMVDIPG